MSRGGYEATTSVASNTWRARGRSWDLAAEEGTDTTLARAPRTATPRRCYCVVVRKDITALQIKPGDGVLKVGAAVQLNLFALNKSGHTDLVPGTMAAWSSTDRRVGEVNGQGRLTPRGAGSVTITATYADQKGLALFTVVD